MILAYQQVYNKSVIYFNLYYYSISKTYVIFYEKGLYLWSIVNLYNNLLTVFYQIKDLLKDDLFI